MNGQRQTTTSNEEILMKLDIISEILVQNLRNIGGHLQDLSNRVQKLEEKKCPHCENRKNHTDEETRQMTIRKTYSPPPKPKGPTKSPCADENFERSHNTKNAIENEDDDEVRQITSRRTYSPRLKPRNATKTPVFFENSEISHSLEKTNEDDSYAAEKVRERAKSRLAARLGKTENDEVESKLQMRTTRGKSPFAPRPKTKQEEASSSLSLWEETIILTEIIDPGVKQFAVDISNLGFKIVLPMHRKAKFFVWQYGLCERGQERWKVQLKYIEPEFICTGKKDDVIRCVYDLLFELSSSRKGIFRYEQPMDKEMSKRLAEFDKEDIVYFAVEYLTFIEMRRGDAILLASSKEDMEIATRVLLERYKKDDFII